MSYRAIIVDDERLPRLTLVRDLEKFPEIVIVGEASGIESAKRLIKESNPDLIFLDIQLDSGSGFDLLNEVEFPGKVIFTTAYDEYAIRAFEINAVDYLLKPVSVKRLSEAIRKLGDAGHVAPEYTEVRLKYDDRLLVMHRKSVNFIKVSSIIAVRASQNYSNIYTCDGKEYITPKSISEWDSRLPEQNFCRIHKSALINFDFIDKIDYHITGTADVKMHGLTEALQVSRIYFTQKRKR